MRQVLRPTETESDIFSFRSSKGEIAFSGLSGGPLWNLQRQLPDGTWVSLMPLVRFASDVSLVFASVPGAAYRLSGGNAGPVAWAQDA